MLAVTSLMNKISTYRSFVMAIPKENNIVYDRKWVSRAFEIDRPDILWRMIPALQFYLICSYNYISSFQTPLTPKVTSGASTANRPSTQENHMWRRKLQQYPQYNITSLIAPHECNVILRKQRMCLTQDGQHTRGSHKFTQHTQGSHKFTQHTQGSHKFTQHTQGSHKFTQHTRFTLVHTIHRRLK